MRLDWLILADYVDVKDNLATLVGAAWNRITRPEPGESLPEGVVAWFQGGIGARLLVDPQDTGIHQLEVTIESDDRSFVHPVFATFIVEAPEDPRDLDDEGVPLLVPLNLRVPLPSLGSYAVRLSVDGQELGRRPFRVV